MHNRARLIVGSYLTKMLYIDWRFGAAHFAAAARGRRRRVQQRRQLAVGRRNRQRHAAEPGTEPAAPGAALDPSGDYVRRYVPELE